MIELIDLAVRQGSFHLAGISLAVPAGRYAVLMGKSGSGKTTVLEAVAGLRPVASGTVRLAGRDVTHLTPAARRVGYVPQDGALFGTMSVRDNLGFALDVRGDPPAAVGKRVDELAGWLGLVPLLGRRPHGLSGGEKQRVALGRALAARPPVLLLDEPLSSLDDDTRDELVELLLRVRAARDVTVLHVTHSRAEAARLGDLVFRLEGGAIVSGEWGA
ncbi:MAG: ATP-binding cassette domain-containing protein [Gemmataceae bacterium]|nr:ATP-binding cassette domain-containing protein [Gemmataceae bacterium]